MALTLTVERHMPANALFSSLHLSGNDFFHFSTIRIRSKLPGTKSIQAILANHNRLQIDLAWAVTVQVELAQIVCCVRRRLVSVANTTFVLVG